MPVATEPEIIVFYCAHAIFYFQLQNASQESFLVQENIYFVEARDGEAALDTALNIAKANEDVAVDGHLELNEQKASYLFAGIRKIIEIESGPDIVVTTGLVGLELTYSEFEVGTFADVLALAQGETVGVSYRN